MPVSIVYAIVLGSWRLHAWACRNSGRSHVRSFDSFACSPCVLSSPNIPPPSLPPTCCTLPQRSMTAVFGCNDTVLVVRNTSSTGTYLRAFPPRVGSFINGVPGKQA